MCVPLFGFRPLYLAFFLVQKPLVRTLIVIWKLELFNSLYIFYNLRCLYSKYCVKFIIWHLNHNGILFNNTYFVFDFFKIRLNSNYISFTTVFGWLDTVSLKVYSVLFTLHIFLWGILTKVWLFLVSSNMHYWNKNTKVFFHFTLLWFMMGYIPWCPLRSHSLAHSKNSFYLV